MLHGDHFLGHLGFTFETRDHDRKGTATIVPELCIPGTDRPRIAVLATLADLILGHPPEHPTAATSDLSVHVWRAPESPKIELAASTLKAGRRLIVSEGLFTAEGADEPFGCSLSTFVAAPHDAPEFGSPLPREAVPTLDSPLDERIGARVLEPGVVELHRSPFITNGPEGTIQGGMVALLGELAAESLLDGLVVRDLDVRYLNGVRIGPARTSSRVIGRTAHDVTVRVQIDEPGDRVIAHVLAVCEVPSS